MQYVATYYTRDGEWATQPIGRAYERETFARILHIPTSDVGNLYRVTDEGKLELIEWS